MHQRIAKPIVISILIVAILEFAVLSLPITDYIRLPLVILIAFSAFGFVLMGRDFFEEYFWKIVGALCLLYLIALLSMYLMAKSNPQSKPGQILKDIVNFSSPGTILVLFLAVITVLGFTITITRLQETHLRISDYNRFLIREEKFLKKILNKGKEFWLKKFLANFSKKSKQTVNREVIPKIEVKLMCSVPTLGNVSHHDLFYNKVYQKWREVANMKNVRIEMICIDYRSENGKNYDKIIPPIEQQFGYVYYDEDFENQDDEINILRDEYRKSSAIGRFYDVFIKRGFSESEVRKGVTQAYEIVQRLSETSLKNDIYPLKWPLENTEPPFHLFWARTHAIVAVPLDRNLTDVATRKKVTMVGYETTDPDVIERLLEVFDEWKAKLKKNDTKL